MYKILMVVKFSESEAMWRVGSIEIGVIRARSVTALTEKQRFDARASDEMQGTQLRPSTKHQASR